MSQGVKFYRLGLKTPITSDFYNKSKISDGRIVFARVKDDESDEQFYIWANGIEYKVGSFEDLGRLEQRISAIEDLYVKSIKTESSHEFLQITPVDTSTGEVTIGVNLTIGDLDTSTEGLATTSNVKKWVNQQIADFHLLTYKVVDKLPDASKETMYIIYLVKNEDESRTAKDIYDEYITIDKGNDVYEWELLGNTALNLDNYYTKAEIDSSLAIIDSSINALEDKVNNGVVNSLDVNETEIGATTGYVKVSQNASKGDVTVSMNITVADTYDLESSTNQQGLATSNYVEDRFSWIVYDGAADINDTTVVTVDASTAAYSSEESISIASVSGLKVTEYNETSVSSKNGEIIIG